MTGSDFLCLGQVSKAHGLGGELSVINYADSPFVFDTLDRVYVKLQGRYPIRHRLLSWRPLKGFVLLFLEGVEGRDQAQAYSGAEIWVRRKDLPVKDPDQVYLVDLIGCGVWLTSGVKLGSIREVQQYGGQEIWSIETPQGQEILFPAHESFIVEVHEDIKKVVIDPPPGLIDLYCS
jgi:16S rRNA processing protein RimM